MLAKYHCMALFLKVWVLMVEAQRTTWPAVPKNLSLAFTEVNVHPRSYP